MLLWVGFAILAAAVTVLVTRPLAAPARRDDQPNDAELAVYLDQLSEIEREAKSGLLAEAEAKSARNEISRRILKADSDRSPKSSADEAATVKNAVGPAIGTIRLAALALFPVLSIAVYLMFGSPWLSGQPLAGRLAAPVENATADELVAKVEDALRKNPQDGRGWDVIAPMYISMRRFDDAVDAYARAIRLLGENPARLRGFAEAEIYANNGIVTSAARQSLEKLIALDPQRHEAKIWLALGVEQDGKLTDAAAAYRAVLAAAPAEAPWRSSLEDRIKQIEEKISRSGPRIAPVQPQPPSTEEQTALDAMKPEDREKMIVRMVEQLSERLKSEPKDLAGWLRLIRSYSVLGRRGDATAALATARQSFAGETGALAEIDGLAKELGLGS